MGKSSGTEGKHSRLLEEGEAANLWQMGQNEKYTDGPYHSPTCPRLGHASQVCKGTGSWSMGIGEQAWSDNCCWLWGDGLRGQEGGNPQQGMPMEEDWTAMEAGRYAESRRGRNHYCNLSLPTHRHLPMTIKEAH